MRVEVLIEQNIMCNYFLFKSYYFLIKIRIILLHLYVIKTHKFTFNHQTVVQKFCSTINCDAYLNVFKKMFLI